MEYNVQKLSQEKGVSIPDMPIQITGPVEDLATCWAIEGVSARMNEHVAV